MNHDLTKKAVVFYDGECGFCDWTVQFILRRDRADHFRFASQQSAYGQQALAAFSPSVRNQDTVYVVLSDRVLMKGQAVVYLLKKIRFPWPMMSLLIRILPRKVQDLLYTWVARHRRDFSGRVRRCDLLTAQERSKFLDTASSSKQINT